MLASLTLTLTMPLQLEQTDVLFWSTKFTEKSIVLSTKLSEWYSCRLCRGRGVSSIEHQMLKMAIYLLRFDFVD
jgi:hypothetical protein